MVDTFLSRPLGFQQITDLSASVGLTVPNPDAAYAIITVETQNVRWRDDGTAPTSSVGQLLQVGDVMRYDGPLSALRLIQTAASASANITYYS